MDNNFSITWPGWETVRLIGRGSFGAVYEIQREVRGRTERAALKVISIPQDTSEILDLRSDGYDDESITQYFTDSREKIEDEYAMMADLKGHSNVVYCDDIRTVQHDDSFGWDIYIKMELLTPLKSYLGDGASEAQVIKLGMDICDALKLCEELNIVHRDIKPENIFVSRSGSFKLGDFGIAKTMEGTTGGTKTGTYDYMAPEVYNNRPYHTQADIYSLGLVMYWLLNNRTAPFLQQNGKRPTPSAKTMARDRRFSGDEIPAPLCGSKKLQKIVLKACAFDPKDRYQSAREMREDLQRLSGAAVSAPVVKPKQNSLAAQETELPEEATVGPVFSRNVPPVAEDQDKTVGPTFAPKKAEPVEEDKTVGPTFAPKKVEPVVEEKTVGPQFSPKHTPAPQTTHVSKPVKNNKLVIIIAAVLVGVLALVAMVPGRNKPTQTSSQSQSQNKPQSQSQNKPQSQSQNKPQSQTQNTPPAQTEAKAPERVLVETPLVSLRPSSVDGTLYIFLSSGSTGDVPYTASVTIRSVTDNFGNSYDFSLHADGATAAERSITYNLNGKYTRFCGQIVFLSFADNVKNDKPIQIYCDGVLKFSTYMSQSSSPVSFNIDVEDVRTLEIVYPNSMGSNDQAAVCDAWLESYETP